MGIFYTLILVPMVIQHVVIRGLYINYEKRNRKALTLFFFILTILVACRHESVGNDTMNYMYFFESFTNMEWDEIRERSLDLGFSYFNKLVSLISEDSQFFLAITAIITILMIFPTYKRLCTDSSLTIVLFCTMSTFVMLFSGLRQMLAIGIGFIAYEFVRNKKTIPFIISVCIAMSFHTSAFMIAFMYPLYYANITKKWLIVVVPVLGMTFLFNRQIFSVLSVFIMRYTQYDGTISPTGAFTMIVLFAAFSVFSFLVPDEAKMDREIIGLRNFLLFALILQMFAPLHSLAMRMNYYYIIFIPLLLPKIIEYRNNRWTQVAMAGRHIMIAFFAGYFFFNAYSGGSLNVFPYHFFWENI